MSAYRMSCHQLPLNFRKCMLSYLFLIIYPYASEPKSEPMTHRIMSRIMLLVKANSSLFSYFRFPCLGNKLKLAASLFVWNWLS